MLSTSESVLRCHIQIVGCFRDRSKEESYWALASVDQLSRRGSFDTRMTLSTMQVGRGIHASREVHLHRVL